MTDRIRLGVDIGGTFTDVVAIDEDGNRFLGKTLTTPDQPETAVLRGLVQALDKSGRPLRSVERVIHGTTLVTNAVIERKGSRTALLTTAGFRDQLEIGNEGRFDTYDLFLRRTPPLVPRVLRFPVHERVHADGTVAVEVDEDELKALAERLSAFDVEAVAVSFLHSYSNSSNEQRAAAALGELMPEVSVSISSEVNPQIREYQRTSTTVTNAYVQPLVRRYLTGLAEGLATEGVAGELLIMTSGGGVCSVDTASRLPVRILESGPVGGVQAGVFHARQSTESNLVVFDMGGTTAKSSLVDQAQALTTNEFEVARSHRLQRGSGLPVRAPVVDMIEIGAGGGSIARVDRLGLVKVGPESSGAFPGPSCYGLGGTEPTVTDADLLLGYLSPERFLGGQMPLDADAAARAVHSAVAEPLGVEVLQAAWAIHRVVNESMAAAVRVHAVERGKSLNGYALFALGGAGPMHACHVAEILRARRVISPAGAGVASAFGFLCSPASFESVRSYYERLDDVDWKRVEELLVDMEQEGRQLLKDAGVAADEVTVDYLCDMRYCGQAYEMTVPLPRDFHKGHQPREAVLLAFQTAYRDLYQETSQTPVECLNWRISLAGPDPQLPPTVVQTRGAAQPVEHRDAYFPDRGGRLSTAVYRRADLGAGSQRPGPVIVEEDESTFVLPPGFDLEIDGNGNLIATRR